MDRSSPLNKKNLKNFLYSPKKRNLWKCLIFLPWNRNLLKQIYFPQKRNSGLLYNKIWFCLRSLKTEILTHFIKKKLNVSIFSKNRNSRTIYKELKFLLYSLRTEILAHIIKSVFYFQNKNSGILYKKIQKFFYVYQRRGF